MRKTLLLIFVVALCVLTANASKRERLAEQWADSVYSTLTMEERVAQLFVPRLDVLDTPEGRAALVKMVQQHHVGGFLLGKGTIEGYTNLINAAQKHAKVPLMVTLDGEWGPAMRVSGAPRFPYNMGLGAIQDKRLLYEYGREVGRECRELGIHVDFAPVLDVNSNPQNPVIGYRSFGEDPQHVADLGEQFSRGLEYIGVMAVGKHFPGHGDTNTDSHKALPTIDHDMATLKSVDLLPFQQYINAGMTGIMVGHLRVPALDKSGTPASLSKKITTDLLRKDMDFKGLIFTDALAMKGAVSGSTNNCVSALKAGADVLLGSSAPAQDIIAVIHAVKSGQISEKNIEDRCKRMLKHKYLLGCHEFKPIDTKGLAQRVNSPEAHAVIEKLANASITILRNNEDVLPVRGLVHRRIAVVTLGGKADNEFVRMCSRYADVERVDVTKAMDEGRYDVVLCAVTDNSAQTIASFNKLAARKCFIPVFLINPYKMARFDLTKCPTVIVAYDNVDAMQRAAAKAAFGGIKVDGRFPVNVPGVGRIGDGVNLVRSRLGYAEHNITAYKDMEARIDSIAALSIREHAFPGCQVLVAHKGNVILEKAYGHIDYADGSPVVTRETLYDIASMTKAIGTVSGVMKAYDEGLFRVSDTLGLFIPEVLETDKSSLSVKQLLFHESGLPASINVYKLMVDTASYEPPLFKSKPGGDYTIRVEDKLYANRHARLRSDLYSHHKSEEFDVAVAEGLYTGVGAQQCVLDKIVDTPLGAQGRYKYSDLNFCLLMAMEENLTGVAHDEWLATEVFGPLGATHTTYHPLEITKKSHIAPTELDKFFRNQHLHGYVHDEIAAFSGGVQGNAGLFSTAGDVAKLCQALLNGGEYGGERIFSKETVRLFTESCSKNNRGLGFDKLSRVKSQSHPRASEQTYGHTGFTGTCFWVDPKNEVIIVILTNRVNPSRDNQAFSRINPRGAIIAAVYDSLP